MKYYNLIKLNQFVKSFRLKFLGIFILHKTNKRYLALFVDPVNACNLRCKMCYFTDKDYVKRLKGIFSANDVRIMADSFFSRALKLQIGCGTEPTLFKDISSIIKEANKYKVPHISLTTNGNLLQKDLLEDWAKNGLSEITISLHGVHKETYEEMMGKGNFDQFMYALKLITQLKKNHHLSLRINYTFNEDNFEELSSFYKVYEDIDIDTLQIRPIVRLGNTEYNNFSMEKVIPIYDAIHKQLLAESTDRGVRLLSHNPSQLQNRQSLGSVINKYVYCYISPTSFYNNDFLWGKETYNQYAKRTNISKKIWKDVFTSRKNILKDADDKLNYEVIN